MTCSFCNEKETEGWLKSYCKACANLRRMLVLYDSDKCIDILNRVLLRTDAQITNKINMELKKPILTAIKKEIQDIKKEQADDKKADDKKDYDKPSTRSKTKVELK